MHAAALFLACQALLPHISCLEGLSNRQGAHSHSGLLFWLVQGAATASGDDGSGSGNDSSGGGGGNWAAVKDASIRLGKSASRKGLARVASLVTDAGSRRASGSSQQQQDVQSQGQAVRQIPIIEQQPEPEQARQQQQQEAPQPLPQQQQPRQIPVIDMSQAAEQQQEQQGRQQQQQQQQQDRQQQQQDEQGRDVVLPYLCGFDNPMAEAAVAQEAAAADRSAAPSATPEGGPGNPEHLFPPGTCLSVALPCHRLSLQLRAPSGVSAHVACVSTLPRAMHVSQPSPVLCLLGFSFRAHHLDLSS